MDDEATLLRRAQEQDLAALGEIYDRYAARLYSYVCSYLAGPPQRQRIGGGEEAIT